MGELKTSKCRYPDCFHCELERCVEDAEKPGRSADRTEYFKQHYLKNKHKKNEQSKQYYRRNKGINKALRSEKVYFKRKDVVAILVSHRKEIGEIIFKMLMDEFLKVETMEVKNERTAKQMQDM